MDKIKENKHLIIHKKHLMDLIIDNIERKYVKSKNPKLSKQTIATARELLNKIHAYEILLYFLDVKFEKGGLNPNNITFYSCPLFQHFMYISCFDNGSVNLWFRNDETGEILELSGSNTDLGSIVEFAKNIINKEKK